MTEPSPGATQIAVASYIHPGIDSGAAQWTRMIESPSDTVAVVVANVVDGPGRRRDDAWKDVIDRAHHSGKNVLGYVRTGYLGRSADRCTTRRGSTAFPDWIAQIEADVDAWYRLYGAPIGGIFFDEGHNECGAGNEVVDIYRQLSRYAKTRHPGALTVLNPGIAVPRSYEDAADILLTFEGSADAYVGNAEPAANYVALDWTPRHPSKIWHIVHTASRDRIPEIIAEARTRGAGYVQITDEGLDNPYDSLPDDGYWNEQIAAVAGGCPVVAHARPVP